MLFGSFKEGKEQQTTDNWVVELPEDNPAALRILLNVAHCQVGLIPAVLQHEDMFNLTILCDKYDMVGLLKPFWRDWINNLKLAPCTPTGLCIGCGLPTPSVVSANTRSLSRILFPTSLSGRTAPKFASRAIPRWTFARTRISRRLDSRVSELQVVPDRGLGSTLIFDSEIQGILTAAAWCC